MPRTRTPYPADFREQIVALVRAGRSAEELAKEFEPCAATIHSWVKQAERDAGRRADILTSAEREELRRLRRENRQLREERDILSKAAAWFAQSDRRPRGLRVHDREPGRVPDRDDGEDAGRLAQRLLRVASPAGLGPCRRRCRAFRTDQGDPCGLQAAPTARLASMPSSQTKASTSAASGSRG